MKFEVERRKVKIAVPMFVAGKFRWKERKTNNDYGDSFATRTKPFNKYCYLEWQIGYDVKVSEAKGDKATTLTDKTFVGANNAVKYPYELAEILVGMLNCELLSKEEFNLLIKQVEATKTDFEKQFPLTRIDKGLFNADNFQYHRNDIILPTFTKFYDNNTGIEISIQKQQNATGVQPMLYICIPITCIEDYEKYIGRSSYQGEEGCWVIDENNKDIITNLFKTFAQLSWKHKHDIQEILKIVSLY